jgi:hypothetical protein
MERRLKMIIAGSIAVWVPVGAAAQAHAAPVDMAKTYRLKAVSPAASDTHVG